METSSSHHPTDVAALVVAAGRGTRLGGDVPKQYAQIAGKPLLSWTLEALMQTDRIGACTVVIHPDDEAAYRNATASLSDTTLAKLSPPVHGGQTRRDSVAAGLRSLPDQVDIVLIHDGCRPFVQPALIERGLRGIDATGAAIPVVPVTDTLKQVSGGKVVSTLERSAIRAVQTPQFFKAELIRRAHARPEADNEPTVTDDAMLVEMAGIDVVTFEGDPANIKITLAADLAEAERRLGGVMSVRTGFGYDVHAFGPGDHVWLGGVKIPHAAGIIAHSDGDVVLHALTDAVLGAIADGDIGVHFPPSDPAWKGASSDRFLADACRRLREKNGRIEHIDVAVLAESPKIGPHREAIRMTIAGIAEIGLDRVSIKATTSEKLGFIGRSEGLAAQAVVTIMLPHA